jgi:hypothetical protein
MTMLLDIIKILSYYGRINAVECGEIICWNAINIFKRFNLNPREI